MKKILKMWLWIDKWLNPLKTQEEWRNYESRKRMLDYDTQKES